MRYRRTVIPRVGDVSLSQFVMIFKWEIVYTIYIRVDTRTVHSQPYITNNTFSQRQHQRIQTIKLKAEPRDILSLIYPRNMLNYPEIDIMQINLKILSWAVAGDSENTNSIRNETEFSSDVSKKNLFSSWHMYDPNTIKVCLRSSCFDKRANIVSKRD